MIAFNLIETAIPSHTNEEIKMSSSNETLLQLDGIEKIFYTEDMETHALAGVHLEI